MARNNDSAPVADNPSTKGAGVPHGVAIVIPVYNHGTRIEAVVREALALHLPLIVVDDGSTDRTAHALSKINGIRVLRHAMNQGKGAALLTGMSAAAEIAEWAVTLDADGQHRPSDARRLLQARPADGRPIIIGCRQGMRREKAPWTSRFGRGFSNFWVWVSGGPRLTDTQSGFRLYPLPEVLSLGVRARRFQFEIEVLVKANWLGTPVLETPVGVAYRSGPERISHFRPFVDFMRNTAVFTRLIFLRIFVPRSLRARLRPSARQLGKDIKTDI